MGEKTKISWTDSSFSPWWGCSKVSPGCANCYAEALSARFGGDLWGVGKQRRRTSPATWREPLKWSDAARKAGERRRVFCASMADWLDDEVPVEWLADLLGLVTSTPQLDWLLLTKRPENWAPRMEAVRVLLGQDEIRQDTAWHWLRGTAPHNVWLGVSVEDQRRADERIPALLEIPARVRFLSVEPLLEAVQLSTIPAGDDATYYDLAYPGGPGRFDNRTQRRIADARIDWVIVGGESGPGARPFDLAWARSLVRQCREADVACFVKQLGAHPVEDGETHWMCPECGSSAVATSAVPWCEACRAPFALDDEPTGRRRVLCRPSGLRHPKGGDPAEWPADLRIRQWPEVSSC